MTPLAAYPKNVSRSWREGHHERDDERFGPSRPARTRPTDRDCGRRLPLFGACKLAVHTTLVSRLHCDGTPHRGADASPFRVRDWLSMISGDQDIRGWSRGSCGVEESR